MLSVFDDFASNTSVLGTNSLTLGGLIGFQAASGAKWRRPTGSPASTAQTLSVGTMYPGTRFASPGSGVTDPREWYTTPYTESVLTDFPGDVNARDADIGLELQYQMQAPSTTGTPFPLELTHHYGGTSAQSYVRDCSSASATVTSVQIKVTPSGSTHAVQVIVCNGGTRYVIDATSGGLIANTLRSTVYVRLKDTMARVYINGTMTNEVDVGARRPRMPFLMTVREFGAYRTTDIYSVRMFTIRGEYFPMDLSTLLRDEMEGPSGEVPSGRAPEVTAFGNWVNDTDANTTAVLTGAGKLYMENRLSYSGSDPVLDGTGINTRYLPYGGRSDKALKVGE